MKILHCVESYFPSTGGMQEVVKQLSERLVRLGHDVTVLTRFHPGRKAGPLNGVKIAQFHITGNPRRAQTPAEQEYVDYLLTSDADIVTFFAAQQWATDLALPVLHLIRARKVSVPTGYSGLYKEEYAEYYAAMRVLIHGYDMNIYLSHDYRDINFARENGVKRLAVVPNGAAEEEFLPAPAIDVRKHLGISPSHLILLHVGSYTGRKGQREAMEIFLQLPSDIKATLLLIGNDHDGFWRQYVKRPRLALLRMWRRLVNGRRIVFRSFPREFTVAAYRQADLFLFPSNVECSPIVLFEAAAAGLPFLTTDVGNAKEICAWTGGGELLPTVKDEEGYSHADIKASVAKTTELLLMNEKRREMGQRGLKSWKENFTWEKIAREYESIYLGLIHDHS
jgi:L-malate glycosyltransferase